jgi:hypothetical protein
MNRNFNNCYYCQEYTYYQNCCNLDYAFNINNYKYGYIYKNCIHACNFLHIHNYNNCYHTYNYTEYWLSI